MQISHLLILAGILIIQFVSLEAATCNSPSDCATWTSRNNPYCIGTSGKPGVLPFYWEIGNLSHVIVSGQNGSLWDRNSSMAIASASKLYFGAYVVQRDLVDSSYNSSDESVYQYLTMRSGFAKFKGLCTGLQTVSGCFNQLNNNGFDDNETKAFAYGGGHFQSLGASPILGLGTYKVKALEIEYQNYLKDSNGNPIPINFSSPAFAGGMKASASDYAIFLRSILDGSLDIRNRLGQQPIGSGTYKLNGTVNNTVPCNGTDIYPTDGACYSPIAERWHYSYGHWIEDDQDPSNPNRTLNDGAFSSPGLFGFYPWIDQTKTYYGIIARYSNENDAFLNSAECGRRIRYSFLNSVALMN